MDPYLEQRWSDVHATLIALIKEALQPSLPRSLRARSEERVLLESDEEERVQTYRSDIAVIDAGSERRVPRRHASAGGSTATIEPVIVELDYAPLIDRYIYICDITNGNRVVTAIEILSHWNKAAGNLNKHYVKKLEDYRRGQVSVVEIDLLREPPRTWLPVKPQSIPSERHAEYVVCIQRAWANSQWDAYPISIRQPLPRIPIPLRQTDAEIGLELQPLIEHVYVAGGHDDIDYGKPCIPPLEGDNAAWAKELLQAAGERAS
jgi:hypothetical protein